MRSTSWPEPGNHGRSGLAHRTCSKWPRGRLPGILHGNHRIRRGLVVLHVQHQELPAFLGSGSCAPSDRPDRTSSSGRSFQLRSSEELGSQPGRDRGPGSGSTAWSQWFGGVGIRWTRGRAACLSPVRVTPTMQSGIRRTVVAEPLGRRADLSIVANVSALEARTTR
jgi:hypothetical protein